MSLISPNTKWSFSRLEAYHHCPMMYYLQYVQKVPQDDNAFALYGTFAHKLLEQYANHEIPDFLLAGAWADGYDEAVTRPFPPFPKGMGEKYYQQGLQYFESFTGFGDQYEIVSAEQRFELNIGGYPFVGVADLILRDRQTGELTVVDHKSKSAATMKKDLPSYRKQLYVYAAYVREKYGVYPKYLKFNLFRENEWVTEEFDETVFHEVMQWVVDTIEEILLEADWKVSCSSYFCRFVCGVFNDCPAREAVLNPLPKEKKVRKNESD